MGFNQIGYPGANQVNPRINFQQASVGAQVIGQVFGVLPVTLQGGQSYIIPAGQWYINRGQYSDVQYYDTYAGRWRALSNGQASQMISSDGVNFRIANLTGTPIGAVITNVGAGNATNGYNTITVAPSAGNSTWGTLVGGTLNTTVTVTAGGNFSVVPNLVWTPASNQTLPFIPPSFYATMAGNAITSVTCQYPGAGLTAAGTLTAVNQPTDTNPGGATLTLNATLTNSGNLVAMWPLTQGNALTAVPTFTFTGTGSGWAATAIMNFTVTGFTVGTAGANMGVSAAVTVISSNGVVTATQNAALSGTDYTTALGHPRMAWLATKSEANGNLSNNGNVVVTDGGLNLQAVPLLIAIPANFNGSSTNALPVMTAQVGGIVDTSFLQCI